MPRTCNPKIVSERAREHREIVEMPAEEEAEVANIFRGYGLDESSIAAAVQAIRSDPEKWVEFMMRFELGLEKPDINRARLSARNIGLSYIVGGIVPLTAYFFTTTPRDGLIYSSIITVLCLMIFGYFKSKVTGQSPWKGAMHTTMIGILAAAAAFFIGHLFS